MSVLVFKNNEKGYLSWVRKHPNGVVVNTRRVFDSGYLVLHRASCSSVRDYPGSKCNPGGFTERSYQRLCAERVEELREYLSDIIRHSQAFSKYFSRCKPPCY